MTRRGRAARPSAAAALLAAACCLAAPAGAQLAVDQLEIVLVPAGGAPGTSGAPLAPGAASPVGVFTVLNDADRPAQATLRVEDWDRSEDGDNRFFPGGTLPQSCGDRLQLFPRAVRLEPHAQQAVRVALVGAPPAGACWAVVFIETQEPRAAAGRAINYVLRTGVKVYVEPPGLPRDGIVEAMRVEPAAPPVAKDAPAASAAPAAAAGRVLSLAFRNTGGVHVVARGSVELRRPDNTVAATLAVPDLHALPGALRRVRLPLPALAPGRYVALALIDFGGAELAAGQIDVEAR